MDKHTDVQQSLPALVSLAARFEVLRLVLDYVSDAFSTVTKVLLKQQIIDRGDVVVPEVRDVPPCLMNVARLNFRNPLHNVHVYRNGIPADVNARILANLGQIIPLMLANLRDRQAVLWLRD